MAPVSLEKWAHGRVRSWLAQISNEKGLPEYSELAKKLYDERVDGECLVSKLKRDQLYDFLVDRFEAQIGIAENVCAVNVA